MSSGWIMLHRKLTDWEWYDDINTSRLFIHLLLTANHKDNNWRGINIKRGSRLTSLDKISKETNLSVSKIRTSVKKLILTRELASKSHAQHTVFTVINYDEYQGDDKLHDKPVTNQSQSNDKALATNNNVKNENNDNKKEKTARFNLKSELLALGVNEQILDDFLQIRKAKKATNTKTALALIVSESKKAGLNIADAVEFSTKSGWAGFKADWYKNSNGSFGKQSNHDLSQMNYQSGKL